MEALSIPKLIARRFSSDWKLLLSIFVGMTTATIVASGTPIYLDSLSQLSFNRYLDELDGPTFEFAVFFPEIPLTRKSLDNTEQVVTNAVNRHLSSVRSGQTRYLRTEIKVAGPPYHPLYDGDGSGIFLSRGYIQSMTNLDKHVYPITGRLPSDIITGSEQGAEAEAIVSSQTANHFSLSLDDNVVFLPDILSKYPLFIKIVGIIGPSKNSQQLWTSEAEILDPPPLSDQTSLMVKAVPDEPPLAIFINDGVMFDLGIPSDVVMPFGNETYARTQSILVGHPTRPLPKSGDVGISVPVGFLQNLSGLEQHVRFSSGRMASNVVSPIDKGTAIEAIASSKTASKHRIKVGDTIPFSTTLGGKPITSAHIVGILEATDLSSDYWANTAVYLDPSPVEANLPLLVQPDEDKAPVALFITEETMLRSSGDSRQGSLVTPTWFVTVEKEPFKRWSVNEARNHLISFEEEILAAVPGASVTIGIIPSLTNIAENRNLLARVPMLLILTVTVATTLLFLFMMVTYLVDSREGEFALLKTRGTGLSHLWRLYLFEGVVMVALVVAVAPFVALALVGLLGLLPPFQEITGNSLMPVRLEASPFLISLGVGLVSLIVFTAPALANQRSGILVQMLRMSRPPSLPFFHRYYMDITALVLGGLIFWEMSQRGYLISGGIFKHVEVNEVLLFGPVLFLVALGLLFVRLFPLVMRFVIGESLALISLLAALSIPSLAVMVVYKGIQAQDGITWVIKVTLLFILGTTYWATSQTKNKLLQFIGILLQSIVLVLLLTINPMKWDGLLSAPTAAVIAIVPGQLLFMFLAMASRFIPAWILMGLWRMARNPLQYVWLILLFVMVTGLSVLVTTVGGTLEKSQEERVWYSVGGDIRIVFPRSQVDEASTLRQKLLDIPGVSNTSLALRGSAKLGSSSGQLLAIESGTFSDVSWFREDFAGRPLRDVINELLSVKKSDRIRIPESATSIGLWAKPPELGPYLPLYAQLTNDQGRSETIQLGGMRLPDWQLLTGEIPTDMEGPRYLLSILTFQPTGSASTGSFLVDDIHVEVQPSGERQVLEDFEGPIRWSPIITSVNYPESFSNIQHDVHSGMSAGLFSFGQSTIRGLQGFYVTPLKGPLPVIVSSSTATANGYSEGDMSYIQIVNQWIPTVIKGVADYFPTLKPDGFVVTDLDLLLPNVNVLLGNYGFMHNEAFVRHSTEFQDSTREILRDLSGQNGQVYDGSLKVELLRDDLYVVAGWRPLIFLAGGLAVLVAAFGYITYLLLFAKRIQYEMGLLQSIGLSTIQRIGLLGFEHLAVGLIGLGMGAWAGFQMSRLMISPLAVTDEGTPVIPPFIISTEWEVIIPLIISIGIIFLASLTVLNLRIARLAIYRLTRLE